MAEYVLSRRERVLSLARSLLHTRERTSYSSEDAFSSVLRRIDGMAERGTLRAQDDGELEALIAAVTRNLLTSRRRLLHLAQANQDDAFWSQVEGRLRSGDDPHGTELMQFLIDRLETHEDRILLFGQLNGLTHRAIARELGIGEDAVRKRWQRLRTRLASALEGEHGGPPA